MDWICTNDATGKQDGTITYTNMCNARGGAECDLTVTYAIRTGGGGGGGTNARDDALEWSQARHHTGSRRLGDNSYYITAGGASAQHDWDWITTVIQDKGFDCNMDDRTADYGVLSLQVRLQQSMLAHFTCNTNTCAV